MPFGTRIIRCTPIKHYKSIDYMNIAKIDLFPVVQKSSAGPFFYQYLAFIIFLLKFERK